MNTLSALLTTVLEPAGWEPLPNNHGWRQDHDLDTGGDASLPVALALIPLGDSPHAPLVFTATIPVAVSKSSDAGAIVASFSAERSAVGAVEVSGDHVRYRLAHDPSIAPHSASTVQGLIDAGTEWAGATLPDVLFLLIGEGVELSDSE